MMNGVFCNYNPFRSCLTGNYFNFSQFNFSMPSLFSFSYTPMQFPILNTNYFSGIYNTVRSYTTRTNTGSSSWHPPLKLPKTKNKTNYSSKSYWESTATPSFFDGKGVVINRHSNGYGKPFLDKVKQIANRLNCNYRDLLAVMHAENGINANNWKGKGACGLIQFTDIAITDLNRTYGLNLTKAKINAMTPVDQLDIVEKYYQMWIKNNHLQGKRLTGGELYALTYTPGNIRQEIQARKGDGLYEGNEGLDINKDNLITKSELTQRVNKFYVSDKSFIA